MDAQRMPQHFPADRLEYIEAALETVYGVSEVLGRALDLPEALREVLRVLDERACLARGMISLAEPATGELAVKAVHAAAGQIRDHVRYGRGEGVVGMIMQRGRPIVLERIADEPRFLDRLDIYDRELPFIGVPIRVGADLVGVLAAQPGEVADGMLDEQARLMETIANLVGQTVRLAWQTERERQDVAEERDSLRRTVRGQYGFSNIVGRTRSMQRVFEQVRKVAKWNTTVLIRGETGTGKELIAHAIHYNSPRAAGAFVKLNCAALPENLLESELFGHEKGAFTGALAQRKGRFEQADGGTLFLDEIGEMSPAFQAKLLRVLQEGELERVGGSRTLQVDVRVIAATNRDLEAAVEAGRFREDLYYRLNVMPIVIPPLRERIEDMPEIARFLVEQDRQVPGPRPDHHRERDACAAAPRLAGQRARAGELPGTCRRHVGERHDRPRPDARNRYRGKPHPAAQRRAARRSTSPTQHARRARARHRRARAGRLGASQGRAPARHDAAPDRLPHPDAEDPRAPVVASDGARRARSRRHPSQTFHASSLRADADLSSPRSRTTIPEPVT